MAAIRMTQRAGHADGVSEQSRGSHQHDCGPVLGGSSTLITAAWATTPNSQITNNTERRMASRHRTMTEIGMPFYDFPDAPMGV